jgi:hypothetical protein
MSVGTRCSVPSYHQEGIVVKGLSWCPFFGAMGYCQPETLQSLPAQREEFVKPHARRVVKNLQRPCGPTPQNCYSGISATLRRATKCRRFLLRKTGTDATCEMRHVQNGRQRHSKISKQQPVRHETFLVRSKQRPTRASRRGLHRFAFQRGRGSAHRSSCRGLRLESWHVKKT